MAKVFDTNGNAIPPVPVSAEEKAEMLAYASAVYSPGSREEEGLALSNLRKPKSPVSLQRIEAIANALVSDGSLRVVRVPSVKGGWNIYHVVSQ